MEPIGIFVFSLTRKVLYTNVLLNLPGRLPPKRDNLSHTAYCALDPQARNVGETGGGGGVNRYISVLRKYRRWAGAFVLSVIFHCSLSGAPRRSPLAQPPFGVCCASLLPPLLCLFCCESFDLSLSLCAILGRKGRPPTNRRPWQRYPFVSTGNMKRGRSQRRGD